MNTDLTDLRYLNIKHSTKPQFEIKSSKAENIAKWCARWYYVAFSLHCAMPIVSIQ